MRDDEHLGELSLAEWEYAHRFADHLAVGDPKPSNAGFDAQRVAMIERQVTSAFYAKRQRLKRRRR